MSHLTVLGNTAIANLLLELSREEIQKFQKDLEDSLTSYTCGEERQYQPQHGVVNRPSGQKTLFRPFTSPESVGTKIIVHPAPSPKNSNQQPPLHGVLVLCDNSGVPTGLLNAEEVTGFRTSLSALIPFALRDHVSKIVVFGAGKQALWHCRLALALRGEDIESITIVNRSEQGARQLVQRLREENGARWKSGCDLGFASSQNTENDGRVKALLGSADVVFCTLPTTKPIFTLASLELNERKGAFPLITAVGSWQPDMIEVDPEILKCTSRVTHQDQRTQMSSLVLVDDAESCLTSCGEMVQSGLKREQVSEIGEVIRAYREKKLDEGMHDRLKTGLVVYKSIGVSLTDLVAGNAIMEFARSKGFGTLIDDF